MASASLYQTMHQRRVTGRPRRLVHAAPENTLAELAVKLHRGSWWHGVTCRDLARELRARLYSATRQDDRHTTVSFYNHHVTLLAELLEAEHDKTRAEVWDRFFKVLDDDA